MKEQAKCEICKKGSKAGKGLVIFEGVLLCTYHYNDVCENGWGDFNRIADKRKALELKG